MIFACKMGAYYWATAAAVVGVAWAGAFAWWATMHHGGEVELELSDPDPASPRKERSDA